MVNYLLKSNNDGSFIDLCSEDGEKQNDQSINDLSNNEDPVNS